MVTKSAKKRHLCASISAHSLHRRRRHSSLLVIFLSLAKIVNLNLHNLVYPTFLCPTQAFPGVWEIPVNLHYVEGLASGQCSYLDQCVFALLGSEDVFEWLQEDFRRHYDVSCQEIHLIQSFIDQDHPKNF